MKTVSFGIDMSISALLGIMKVSNRALTDGFPSLAKQETFGHAEWHRLECPSSLERPVQNTASKRDGAGGSSHMKRGVTTLPHNDILAIHPTPARTWRGCGEVDGTMDPKSTQENPLSRHRAGSRAAGLPQAQRAHPAT